MDIGELPELQELLQRLPWFHDLTWEHRTGMLAEIGEQLAVEASSEEFTALLMSWSEVAHGDLKWSRFAILRESGLLEPPRAA